MCCWRLRISGKLGSFTRIASQNQCIVLPAMGGKHLSFHKSMISFRNPPPPSLSPSPSLPLPLPRSLLSLSLSPALVPFPLCLVNTSTAKRMSGCSCLRFPSFSQAYISSLLYGFSIIIHNPQGSCHSPGIHYIEYKYIKKNERLFMLAFSKLFAC